MTLGKISYYILYHTLPKRWEGEELGLLVLPVVHLVARLVAQAVGPAVLREEALEVLLAVLLAVQEDSLSEGQVLLPVRSLW